MRVYQLALAQARDVYAAVMEWDSFAQWSFGLQLVRAADSIPANIAEAMGRESVADRRRLLVVSRSSRPSIGCCSQKSAASAHREAPSD